MSVLADIDKDDAYFAHPTENATGFGIILVPDFMGYELVNTKLYEQNMSIRSARYEADYWP